MSSWLDWVWLSIAAVASLLGLALLIRALFLDRAKGRKRCPKCWYDMSDQAARHELRCPECGRVAKSHKRLTKTRRHRKQAALALLFLLVGLSSFHWMRVRSDVRLFGWQMAVPYSINVWIAPVDPEPFRLGNLWATDDWSKIEWDLNSGVILRDEDHPTLVQIYYWRQDRAIKKRGMLGVDPQDTELVRRMYEDRIEPISGTMTVKQAFDTLSERAGVPIGIDWAFMSEWDASPNKLITLPDIDDITVNPHDQADDILEYAIPDPTWMWNEGPRWDIVEGQVVVRKPDLKSLKPRVVRYSVSKFVLYDQWCERQRLPLTEAQEWEDLWEHEESTEERLADIVRQFIDNPGWEDNGGSRGDIAGYNTRNLLILTTPRNHYEIRQLLDDLERRVPRDKHGDFVLPTDPRRVKIEP